MRPVIIGFGLLILCLLILFRIGEVNFIKGDVRLEVIVSIAALIFFFVGLYFNYHSKKNPGSLSHHRQPGTMLRLPLSITNK